MTNQGARVTNVLATGQQVSRPKIEFAAKIFSRLKSRDVGRVTYYRMIADFGALEADFWLTSSQRLNWDFSPTIQNEGDSIHSVQICLKVSRLKDPDTGNEAA